MKKIFSVMLSVLMAFQILGFAAFAEDSYIIVEDGYISADTVKKLDIKAKNIFREYGFSVYFVMSKEVSEKGAYAFSQDFYSSVIKNNGVVFCMDAESGKCYIYGGDDIGDSDREALMKAYTDIDALNTGERVGAYIECAALLAEKLSLLSEKPESSRLMPRFMDNADIIDDDRESAVYTDIDALSEKKLSDIVFVTYKGSEKPSKYASKYYSENDFGFGEKKDGIILAVCADTGDLCVKAFGNCEKFFSDDVYKDITASLKKYCESKEYISMFIEYMDRLSEVMKDETDKPENTDNSQADTSVFGGVSGEPMGRINDSADIISPQTEKEISLILDEVSSDTGLDFVVATTYDFPADMTAKEYAEQYFAHYDFGLGEEKNGILMVISLNPEYCFLTAFGSAEKYFGKGDLKKYTEAFYTQFKRENYDDAALIFARESAKRLMREKLELPVVISLILTVVAAVLAVAIIVSRKKESVSETVNSNL